MKVFFIILAIVLVIGVVMVGADFVKGVIAGVNGEEIVETTTVPPELPKYVCLKGGRFFGANYAGTKYYYLVDTVNKMSYYIASDVDCLTGSVTINEDNKIYLTIDFDSHTQENRIYQEHNNGANDGYWYVTLLGDRSKTKHYDEVSIKEFVNMWNRTVDNKDLNVKKLTVEQFS